MHNIRILKENRFRVTLGVRRGGQVDLTHAMDRSSFIESLSADVTEPSFMVRWLGPAMRHGILD